MLRLSLLLLLLPCSTHSVLLGWVESPGYPMSYSPHAKVNWSRCAPQGHILSIRFIHLDLEESQDCENDAVKVFSNGSLISVLCGKKKYKELQETVNPFLFSSPGGCLTLLFHSDYSNTQRHIGFRGFYSVQDFDECQDHLNNECTQFCHNFVGGYHCSCQHGYYLAENKHTCTVSCAEDLSGLSEGDISSPSWPKSYAENANCQYTLSVEEHRQLELHFSEVFDVEQDSDGQCIDALTIETHPGTLRSFCGNKPPPSPLLTHSNHIQIRFVSDSFGSNKGFSIHFKTRDKVCRPEVTSNSMMTPQKAEYQRGETVKVTCDVGHVANLGMLTEYETTCQETGRWAPNYLCEIVDCGLPPIEDDGILQLVPSAERSTKYNNQIQFYCSSKYYKLEGNDTYICSASSEWVSVDGNQGMPKCTEVCGMPEVDSSSPGRILGGRNATLGEIPWQLLIKEPHRGGASLINDQWAVTAAHVVDKPDKTLKLLGGLVDGLSTSASVITSEKIIIHPDYANNEGTNFDNDIALIRFKSRVNLGPNLLPICLPRANRGVVENEQGTVSGWGITDANGRLKLAQFLQYTHMPVYSLSVCENTPTLPNTNKKGTFTGNMFCSGAKGKDSCPGDSGGPFVTPMLSSADGPHYLMGIVSWGPRCRDRIYKGYYTKVENYVDWIQNTIEKEEK